jgi:hypothetical protein
MTVCYVYNTKTLHIVREDKYSLDLMKQFIVDQKVIV